MKPKPILFNDKFYSFNTENQNITTVATQAQKHDITGMRNVRVSNDNAFWGAFRCSCFGS